MSGRRRTRDKQQNTRMVDIDQKDVLVQREALDCRNGQNIFGQYIQTFSLT